MKQKQQKFNVWKILFFVTVILWFATNATHRPPEKQTTANGPVNPLNYQGIHKVISSRSDETSQCDDIPYSEDWINLYAGCLTNELFLEFTSSTKQ